MRFTFLAIAMTHRNGTSVHKNLLTLSSADVDPATSIVTYKNDLRRATIITAIDAVFFKGLNFGVTRAKLLGFALIDSGSAFANRETSFDVDLNLVSLSVSFSPSSIPTPSSIPNIGTLHYMEVWGEYCVFFSDPCSKPHKPLFSLMQLSAACLCDLHDRFCSPDVLTNFNNEASLCIFSKRDLVKIDLLRIQWGVTMHDIIVNSEIVDGDLSSSAIKLEGTQGSAVFKIPKSFFTGMEDSGGSLRDVGGDHLIQGEAVGVAAIKSDSGGNSEVGMTMFGEISTVRTKLTFFLLFCFCC